MLQRRAIIVVWHSRNENWKIEHGFRHDTYLITFILIWNLPWLCMVGIYKLLISSRNLSNFLTDCGWWLRDGVHIPTPCLRRGTLNDADFKCKHSPPKVTLPLKKYRQLWTVYLKKNKSLFARTCLISDYLSCSSNINGCTRTYIKRTRI